MIRIRICNPVVRTPDPDQTVTDPEHWLEAERETEEKKTEREAL
jgi:hypothetical protein